MADAARHGVRQEHHQVVRVCLPPFLMHTSALLFCSLFLIHRLMLGFYGFVLADKRTGRLERAPDYRERFAHLNRCFHNNLRISEFHSSFLFHVFTSCPSSCMSEHFAHSPTVHTQRASSQVWGTSASRGTRHRSVLHSVLR